MLSRKPHLARKRKRSRANLTFLRAFWVQSSSITIIASSSYTFDSVLITLLTIAEIVASVRRDDELGTGEDDDDTGDPLPRVRSHQAFAAFLNIQAYLLCQGNDADQCYCLLKDLEIELTKTASSTHIW